MTNDELQEALRRESRTVAELSDKILRLRYGLNKVRCFAVIRGGARCSRRAWAVRRGYPVCTAHKRARTFKPAVVCEL